MAANQCDSGVFTRARARRTAWTTGNQAPQRGPTSGDCTRLGDSPASAGVLARQAGDDGGSQPAPSRVVMFAGGKLRVAASGLGIDEVSLGLSGDELHWVEMGVRHLVRCEHT
jgi:hypothetical protein